MTHLYPAVVEAGSAVEDCLSSGLSSVEARSVESSELVAEVVGAAGAVVLGVDVTDEGWGAAEAVLGYKSIFKKHNWINGL